MRAEVGRQSLKDLIASAANVMSRDADQGRSTLPWLAVVFRFLHSCRRRAPVPESSTGNASTGVKLDLRISVVEIPLARSRGPARLRLVL